MKTLKTIAACAIAIIITGCNNDETTNVADGRTAVKLTTTSISSRATDNAWEAGDNIGLVMFKTGTGTVSEGLTAYNYVTTTGNGAFTPIEGNTAYYPTAGGEVDVLGYYPFTTAPAASNMTVAVNTTDQSVLSKIDFMTSDLSTGHSSQNSEVSLNFKHRLAKVNITVEKDATVTGIDLSGATVAVMGTAATATWSLSEFKLTNIGAAAEITVPMILTGAGTDANAKLTGTAIVMPTEAGKGVKITITTKDDHTFIAQLPATTPLAQGTENNIKVMLGYTESAISVTINDWATGVTADLPSLKMNITATDGTEAGVNAITIWKAGNAAASSNYTYNETTKTWSSNAPFYLETIGAGDTFYARHTPTNVDAVTAVPDILGNTVASSVKEGGIALSMEHLLAKLDIAVVKASNMPASIDLNGAIVTLNGVKKGYNVSDANVAAANGAAAELVIATNASTKANIIVAPQTIAAGTVFKVTLKSGYTYSSPLNTELALTAGKQHTLTLTVDPTKVNISATVEEWGTGANAAQAIKIDGISNAAAGNLETKAGDQLTLICGTQSATYTYADNAWGSTAPLYWDNITGTSLTFGALFTPKAAATAGNEKDYLAGAATGLSFGAPINLTLTHAMAQIKVKLIAGEGYTSDNDLLTKLEKRAINLQGLSGIAATATGVPTIGLATTLASITGSSAFANDTFYTVAPQELTNAHTIVLTLTNGNKYTVKLTDIAINSSDKLTALEAGQQYIINLTVNNSELKISATLQDWKQTIGEGTATPNN